MSLVTQLTEYQLMMLRVSTILNTPVVIAEPLPDDKAKDDPFYTAMIEDRFTQIGLLISLELMEEVLNSVRIDNYLYRLVRATPQGQLLIDTSTEITH